MFSEKHTLEEINRLLIDYPEFKVEENKYNSELEYLDALREYSRNKTLDKWICFQYSGLIIPDRDRDIILKKYRETFEILNRFFLFLLSIYSDLDTDNLIYNKHPTIKFIDNQKFNICFYNQDPDIDSYLKDPRRRKCQVDCEVGITEAMKIDQLIKKIIEIKSYVVTYSHIITIPKIIISTITVKDEIDNDFVINFGKHKGVKISTLSSIDSGYVEWLKIQKKRH